MKIWLLIFVLLINGSAISQNKVLLQIPSRARELTEFIPKGYVIIDSVGGDLNKDKSNDCVIVMGAAAEKKEDLTFEEIDSLPGRLLVIVFRDSDGWQLSAKTDSLILCRNCGGIFGDPFAGISIEKRILTVNHYGGSAWRWSYNHKFRYQQNDFYLIGQTILSYWNVESCEKLDEFAGTDYEDVNFVTGQYEKKKVSTEGCKLLINKKGKRAIKPLIKLENFSIGQ